MERVTITTGDNVKIAGNYAGESGRRGVLLVHMMPATKESWYDFSEKLVERGFQALAIDLRGHGESEGGPDGYKKFSDKDHRASIKDIGAGVEFLKSKKASSISLAGASIGANLALEYAAGHLEISKVMLLSPGLDYRGVKTEPVISRLRDGQSIYFVASLDDPYSADTVKTLSEMAPVYVEKVVKVFENAGHGTTIFEKEPAFMDEVAEWLTAN
ncbi:MAG: alpha/beta fold hydrolase [Candidatus Sungbacteria bacterium]|nr:alpha/beta fold hydrolase [Candidatus Sungbacteria bacterium]